MTYDKHIPGIYQWKLDIGMTYPPKIVNPQIVNYWKTVIAQTEEFRIAQTDRSNGGIQAKFVEIVNFQDSKRHFQNFHCVGPVSGLVYYRGDPRDSEPVYTRYIPGIYQWKLEILHDTPLVVESCFVCVGVMSYVSDRSVTCVVRCQLSASRLF